MIRFKKKHKSKPVKKRQVLQQMQPVNGLSYVKAPGSPSQFSDDIGTYTNPLWRLLTRNVLLSVS